MLGQLTSKTRGLGRRDGGRRMISRGPSDPMIGSQGESRVLLADGTDETCTAAIATPLRGAVDAAD